MDMKMFLLAKSLSHIVCHHFQLMKDINGNIPNIQEVFNKGRPLRMSQFKWFNFKSQVQNKIGFSYLGVGLISGLDLGPI